MLTFAIVNANPVGADAVTAFGVFILVLVAAVVVGVWIAVARQLAQRGAADVNEDVEGPGLEALRHQHLVVQPTQDRQASEVIELVPDNPDDAPAGQEQLADLAPRG
jgi:hypothetical protein